MGPIASCKAWVAKSVILDTSTYSSHLNAMVALQLSSVIGRWNCLASEEAHEICQCPTSPTNSSRNLDIRAVYYGICVFQNNRGDVLFA